MEFRNCTVEELEAALAKVNEKYNGNVKWKRFPERSGRRFKATLTVESSKGAGARRGRSGQRVAAACWHVHGDFFDALFDIQPEAAVKSAGNLITRQSGNWQDSNIGSMMQPLMYSRACDCGNGIRFEQKPAGEVRLVRQDSLTAECWLVQAFGTDRCQECELRDTEECGGKSIRETGKNEKGCKVTATGMN